MPKGGLGVDRVSIPSPFPHSSQVPGLAKVGDDALNRPFGDAHPGCDVSGPNPLVLMNTDQHMAVVREKRPLSPGPMFGMFRITHGTRSSRIMGCEPGLPQPYRP